MMFCRLMSCKAPFYEAMNMVEAFPRFLMLKSRTRVG